MPHAGESPTTDKIRLDIETLVERRGVLEREITDQKIILTAAKAGQIITTAETQAAAIVGEARADARRTIQKAESEYQARRATEQARLENELNGIKASLSAEIASLTSQITEMRQALDELHQGREKLSEKVLDALEELKRIAAESQRKQRETQEALTALDEKQAKFRYAVVELVNLLEPYCA